jgi:hypothetical protein
MKGTDMILRSALTVIASAPAVLALRRDALAGATTFCAEQGS